MASVRSTWTAATAPTTSDFADDAVSLDLARRHIAELERQIDGARKAALSSPNGRSTAQQPVTYRSGKRVDAPRRPLPLPASVVAPVIAEWADSWLFRAPDRDALGRRAPLLCRWLVASSQLVLGEDHVDWACCALDEALAAALASDAATSSAPVAASIAAKPPSHAQHDESAVLARADGLPDARLALRTVTALEHWVVR